MGCFYDIFPLVVWQIQSPFTFMDVMHLYVLCNITSLGKVSYMNQFFQQSLHPFSSVSTNVICMFFAQTAASLLPGCALSSAEKQKSEQFFRGASVHVTAKRWATKTGTDSASIVLFVLHVVLSDIPVLCAIGRAVLRRHPGRTATGEENHDHGRRGCRSRQVAYVKTHSHLVHMKSTAVVCLILSV